MKSTLIIGILLSWGFLAAQDFLIEEFSDGTLQANPPWMGDLDHFIINEKEQLQLHAPNAGSSVIYTDYPIIDTMEWKWTAQWLFSPSNSNQLQVYFMIDTPDLEIANGLMVQIGESGSNDALELYQLNNGKKILLNRGADGKVSSEGILNLVQIIRHGIHWIINANFEGLAVYENEMNVEYSWLGGDHAYFAIKCIYTSTRTDKFIIDDIYAIPIQNDTTGPQFVNLQVIDDHSVRITFDESLDSLLVFDKMNYRLSPDNSIPKQIAWNKSQPAIIELVWSESFAPFQAYELIINQLNDNIGNSASDLIIPFKYVVYGEPEYGDIIFTEIMADPTPSAGLPEIEFLEIYNAGQAYYKLNQIVLAADGKQYPFPDIEIGPGQFIIVCLEQNEFEFMPFGNTVGLSGFPSLNNAGDELSLIFQQSKLVDQIIYTDNWYQDSERNSGGYSLELINPNNRCSHYAGNWHSSISPIGGTPGQRNSVWNEFTEISPLQIQNVNVVNPRQVQIIFNQVIDPESILFGYSISPDLIIDSIIITPDDPITGKFYFSLEIVKNQAYTLSISPEIRNCNAYSEGKELSIVFGLPQTPLPEDVVINEILFNPHTGGNDYLEIYNRSQKIIDLRSLVLSKNSGDPSTYIPIEKPFLLLPGQYLCITPKISGISPFYDLKNTQAIMENSLPSMPNQEGDIAIIFQSDQDWVVIDQFSYRESMHNPFIDNPNGISLERIDPDERTSAEDNWQSAAEQAGFGTPGYQNSQYLGRNQSKNLLTLEKNILSPNGDGIDDHLIIHIDTDQAGYLLNGQVFDLAGRLVDVIFNQETISTSGIISWDGFWSNGEKARLGRYVILLELLHPEGSVVRYKNTIIIADYF